MPVIARSVLKTADKSAFHQHATEDQDHFRQLSQTRLKNFPIGSRKMKQLSSCKVKKILFHVKLQAALQMEKCSWEKHLLEELPRSSWKIEQVLEVTF